MLSRPLVTLFLCFSLGLLLPLYLDPWIPTNGLFYVILLFLLIGGIMFHKINARFCTFLLAISVVVLGTIYIEYSSFPAHRLYPLLPSLEKVEGQVVNYPYPQKYPIEIELKLDRYPGKLLLYLESPRHSVPSKNISYGDKLIVTGNFQRPTRYKDFNYPQYLERKNIWGIIYEGKLLQFQQGQGSPVLALGWSIRQWVFSKLNKLLPPKNSRLLKGIMFANRTAMAESTVASFKNTGLAHLLASSGLHLGIIISFLWMCLSLVRLKPHWIYGITALVIGLYLLATGFRNSLLRAYFLFLFTGLQHALQRKGVILKKSYDYYQGLAAAGLIILAISPQQLFQLGFKLSFCAVLALITFTPKIEFLMEKITFKYLRSLFAASIAAQLGIVPFLVIAFHKLHIWAPLFNLIAIPITTVILYGGILCLLGGNITGFGIVATCENYLLNSFRLIIDCFEKIPYSSLSVPGIPQSWTITYVLFLFGILIILESKYEEKATYLHN